MTSHRPTACFFSNGDGRNLRKEQYSIQDIRILEDLGFEVRIATNFGQVPWGADLYFSWWATGSILPLVKAVLGRRPIVVVAGGNEAMLYRDSLSGVPMGYLSARWHKKLAARITLRLATRVLVVSDFMLADVRRLGARAPIVVHNSVDRARFHPAAVDREFVTSIFNLDESVVALKRGDVLLNAIHRVLQRFPEQRFLIIGRKGDAFERFSRDAQALGVAHRLTFLGLIDNDAVAGWLQRSKVYVQISDTETFGVTIAEAMSCGTPVVVSRRGAIPEVAAEQGTYVDHNDPASVAEGIECILRMPPEALARVSAGGVERIAANFTFEARRARIKSLLQEVLQ